MALNEQKLGDIVRRFSEELAEEGYEKWGWTLYKKWGEDQFDLHMNGGSVDFTVTLCPGMGEEQ